MKQSSARAASSRRLCLTRKRIAVTLAGVKEPTREQLLAWVKQYRNAAIELEAQRYTELRAMSEAKALRFADALLSIPVANRRRESSGLIEQQAVFQRARKP